MVEARESLPGVTNISVDVSVPLLTLFYVTGEDTGIDSSLTGNITVYSVRHHQAALLLLHPCLPALNFDHASIHAFSCLGPPGTSVTLIRNDSLTHLPMGLVPCQVSSLILSAHGRSSWCIFSLWSFLKTNYSKRLKGVCYFILKPGCSIRVVTIILISFITQWHNIIVPAGNRHLDTLISSFGDTQKN